MVFLHGRDKKAGSKPGSSQWRNKVVRGSWRPLEVCEDHQGKRSSAPGMTGTRVLDYLVYY